MPRSRAPTRRGALRDGGRPQTDDLAAVAPDRLEAVFGPPDPPALLWARMGSLAIPEVAEGVDPAARLADTQAVWPWTGEPLALAEAQALLHVTARRGRGPIRLVAMTRWKLRCLRPFLTGPDGPPVLARRGDPPEAPRAV